MKNIGVDIVEIDRINKFISPKFVNQILTNEELEIYNKYKGLRALQFIAGRLAAKEAIVKAFSKGFIDMKEISILNDEYGAPFVKYKDYDIKISISHEEKYAVAFVILM